MGRTLKGLALPLAAVLMLVVSSRLASGLTINLVYDEAQSQPPSTDPSGAQLGRIVAAAARQWEDIIKDDWTMDLAYTWGDLGNDGTRGAAVVLGTRAGKPTSARIRMDTGNAGVEHDWYFDPTPTDHGEYELPQILYRDLTASQQANAYNGQPPELLETSFAGIANSTAPAIARTGHDLLTVALHEIGHTVGLSGPVEGQETSDLDFDVDPRLVGGAKMAIRVADPMDTGHLAAPRTVMFPAVIPGIRRLPSQTDILAVATAAGWTMIDLPRQDFLGGTSWNQAGNWIGGRVPDGDEAVFVRHGGRVTVDAPATAGELTVSDGSELRVAGSTLTVNQAVFIDGDGSMGSQSSTSGLIQESGRLRADRLVLAGRLHVSSSPSTIDSTSKFLAPSVTVLDADLHLQGSATVRRGASFAGPGGLFNAVDSTLAIDNGAAVPVDLTNRGRLQSAGSPAVMSVASLRQTDSGTFAVKIGGGQFDTAHDQLVVAGTAVLGGVLELGIAEQFQLQAGTVDDVTILRSGEGVEGTFARPPARHQGDGLFVDVNYDSDQVRLQLRQAVAGDANGDGRFDQSDVVQVSQSGRFLSDELADWTQGDWDLVAGHGDGRFDQRDLIAALRAGAFSSGIGAAIGSPAPMQVAEPSTWILLLVGAIALLGLRREGFLALWGR